MPKYQLKPVPFEAFQWTGDVQALFDWRDSLDELTQATLLLVEHPFHTSTLYVLDGAQKWAVELNGWISVSVLGGVMWHSNDYFSTYCERAP